MSKDLKTPAFKEQFEEIARLETALRSGELTDEAATDALHRLYELMDWQERDESDPDTDYLYA